MQKPVDYQLIPVRELTNAVLLMIIREGWTINDPNFVIITRPAAAEPPPEGPIEGETPEAPAPGVV